ncbi:SpoIIE family protein phosphatase [Kitasatospora sp. NPDC088783]|uniref:SpoIIE family protein phosphatase n=1 Tax=Kitasatospora sp. NPDC088783 TaxID=3364077 RepID=UPI0038053EAA
MTTITVATATLEGTAGPLADGVAHFTSASNGQSAFVVIDGMGHDPAIVDLVPAMARNAARAGARKGAVSGLLAAGEDVADPGPLTDDESRPDAVGAIVVTRPDGSVEVAWTGDTRVYHWNGRVLTLWTSDHNFAAYLNKSVGTAQSVPVGALADIVTLTLARISAYAVPLMCKAAGGLVIIASDGAYGQHDAEEPQRSLPEYQAEHLATLVRRHQDNPQALVEAIVAGARPDADGYRDDATALVVAWT